MLALALALAWGCASGERGEEADTGAPQDTATGGDADDAVADVPDDTSADGGDIADTGADGDGDGDGDGAELTPVCEAGTTECVSGTRLRTCRPDGSGFDESPCPSGELCEAGICQLPPQICTPDAVRCGDWQTQVVCSSDGRSESDASCAPGRCLDGACSSGAPTGAACASAADCAGQSCKCAQGLCPGSPLEGGYCTTSDCDLHGCGPGELCVDFGLSGGTRDCILDCGGGCTRPGFACRELPTADGSWQEVCYQADFPRDVGGTCTQAADCLGGLCFTTSPGGAMIDDGYCSAPCEDAGDCPADSACVRDAAFNDGAGYCALLCVDLDDMRQCPPERPDTFDLACLFKGRAEGGGTAQVCFQP